MKKIIPVILLLLFTVSSFCAEIRVMSYNVRVINKKDGTNGWQYRKEATPAMIYDIRPVAFGVQEALREHLDYILEQCPRYKEVGVGRSDGADGSEHMSVFYNTDSLKLITWGNYWLSETPDRPSYGWDAACYRTATWVLFELKSTGEKFYFVNTHLDHKGLEARKKGLQLLYDKIGEMNKENYPMVLTGDFNILPDDPGLVDIDKLMKSARFTAKDADAVGSFNGWHKSEAECTPIDYIYYAGFSDCLTFKVVRHQYAGKKYISDHYPIYSDLVF